jgi:SAM-dependent methyltransferase
VIATLVWAAFAALWMLDATRLRRRARALRTLEPSDDPVADEHGFVVGPGVVLDEPVRRAASAFARAHGLDVLDLIPRDLPAPDAFMLLQTVDFATFRTERLAKPFSAGEAMLVHRDVAQRARLAADTSPPDALAFSKLARRLKQYAPVTMDYAVAPGLHAKRHPLRAGALIRLAFSSLALPIIYLQFGIALAGPFLAHVAGSIALAVMHLQGAVAMLGTALRPRKLAAYALLRIPWDTLRTFGQADSSTEGPAESARRREQYGARLSGGIDRFFEPRRSDCPHCGGTDLRKHVSTGDHLQFKPGRFRLDRCRGCGHIFQNPRLTIDGLNFYYEDCYDGLGEDLVEGLFASSYKQYVERARFVERTVEQAPARWLDVGAGHGHFANVAHDLLPATRIEGIDLSSSIEEAERRRWIDKGYRALFPEAAGDLARDPYDVVSMSHYLEHTREPAAEIAAAATVLRPGGHLFIEVPDPDCRLGSLLGALWMPWLQPQHQHFLNVTRLDTLLRKHGFRPVAWHRGEAHQDVDFFFAACLFVRRIVPPLDLPWRKPDGRLARTASALVWVLSIPLLAAAKVTDLAMAPLARRPGWSNTFRVVARRL